MATIVFKGSSISEIEIETQDPAILIDIAISANPIHNLPKSLDIIINNLNINKICVIYLSNNFLSKPITFNITNVVYNLNKVVYNYFLRTIVGSSPVPPSLFFPPSST